MAARTTTGHLKLPAERQRIALTMRLEDAEGWPLLAPGVPATVEQEMKPGRYVLVSPDAKPSGRPDATEARIVVSGGRALGARTGAEYCLHESADVAFPVPAARWAVVSLADGTGAPSATSACGNSLPMFTAFSSGKCFFHDSPHWIVMLSPTSSSRNAQRSPTTRSVPRSATRSSRLALPCRRPACRTARVLRSRDASPCS